MERVPKSITFAIIAVSFVALIIAGTGMVKEINELEERFELTQKNGKSIEELCKEISGKKPDEIMQILGRHSQEVKLTDLTQRISTKYYDKDELIHSREYSVNGQTVTVFFKKGLVSGWSI